jgi:hypothetical protein
MSVLSLTLLVLAPLTGNVPDPPPVRPELVCRATLEGSALVTTFQHPSGYRVEGIWTLLAVRQQNFDRPTEMLAELMLEHMIESDAVGGRRAAISVALRFRVETEATNQFEALRQAIGAWCGTVLHASELGLHLNRLGPEKPWWLI